MQCVLFNGAARGWWSQTYTIVRLQARLTEVRAAFVCACALCSRFTLCPRAQDE